MFKTKLLSNASEEIVRMGGDEIEKCIPNKRMSVEDRRRKEMSTRIRKKVRELLETRRYVRHHSINEERIIHISYHQSYTEPTHGR